MFLLLLIVAGIPKSVVVLLIVENVSRNFKSNELISFKNDILYNFYT